MDGELCWLGADGRSMFNRLLFRRCVPYFYAFDQLCLNGRGLRLWPPLRRKEELKASCLSRLRRACSQFT